MGKRIQGRDRPRLALADGSKGVKAAPSHARADFGAQHGDLPGAGLALTNYELVLPGRDKILGTDDDLRIRDGLIAERGPRAATNAAESRIPPSRAGGRTP